MISTTSAPGTNAGHGVNAVQGIDSIVCVDNLGDASIFCRIMSFSRTEIDKSTHTDYRPLDQPGTVQSCQT